LIRHIAAVATAEGTPGAEADLVPEGANRTIHENAVNTSGVIGAAGHGRVGYAVSRHRFGHRDPVHVVGAAFIGVPDKSVGPEDGGETGLNDSAVDPPGVAAVPLEDAPIGQ